MNDSCTTNFNHTLLNASSVVKRTPRPNNSRHNAMVGIQACIGEKHTTSLQ